jgi:DNA phosphorothioation-associated putative methyltransferase
MGSNQANAKIARHKTAIRRQSYSLPVKCMLRDGLLNESTSLFDYGCGHGQDLQLLTDAGIDSSGWDPVHRPDGNKASAHVVSLGYVINVIEDVNERRDVVLRAWSLCERMLTVAAQVEFAAPDKIQRPHGDGIVTSRGHPGAGQRAAQLGFHVRPSGGELCKAASHQVRGAMGREDVRQLAADS